MRSPKVKKRRKTRRLSCISSTSEATDCDNDRECTTNDPSTFSLDNLKNIIAKVQSKTWIPPVRVIEVDSVESISVVDINKNHSILVCGYEDSSKFFVKIKLEEKLSQIEDENLLSNYNSLKVAAAEFENRTSHLSTAFYIQSHSLPVTGLKLVEDKDLLLSCSLDGTVRAWNTKRFEHKETFYGIDFISDLDVSSNSTSFVASSYKGKIGLFSLEVCTLEKFFSGHTKDVNCVRFHPNGIYFASSSDDKTIKLWCTQSGNVARTFHDDVSSGTLAFSPDGNFLASYSGGVIKVWDLASGLLLTSFEDSSPDDSSCQSSFSNLCFSEFGGVLASGGAEKEFKLWNVNNLLPSSPLDVDEKFVSSRNQPLEEHILCKKIKLIKFDENNYFTCVSA